MLMAIMPQSLPTALAGMAVMTDSQLADIKGGDLVRIDISNAGAYYGGTNNVTVVRFSSDIYAENYGEFGDMKMGNYTRTNTDLGLMADMYTSGNIIRYDYDRTTANGHPGHDDVVKAMNNYARNFGLSTGPNYTQWDINWEKVRMGGNAQNPLQIYGIVLRAEFSNFGTPNQELRRLVVGSNKLFGYAAARPLVTSGWLSSEMVELSPAVLDVSGNMIFQLQRDCMMDQYWQISSFNFNPNNPADNGSFRDYFFNTALNSVDAGNGDFEGTFVNQDHGFFISLDLTDRRFSGWNIIAGANEYNYWPNFEDDPANYTAIISNP